MMDDRSTDKATALRRERGSAPLISVIMIFLDAERFIEEAIQSVFAQTWPHWELVLVDDGSTDRSTAIAKRYAAEHPERVRYLEHPGHANRGTGASRNLGLARARGEYVAFLDADDVYLPERLERHVEILERHDEVDVVQSAHFCWHNWAGNAEPDKPAGHIPEGCPIILEGCPIVRPPSLLGNLVGTLPFGPPQTGSLTIRGNALSRTGTFEEAFQGMYEDQVLIAKLYTNTVVYLLAEVLVYYRQHAQSLCTTMLGASVWNRQRPNPYTRAFFIWLNDYLGAQQVPDEAIRRAAAARLRPYLHPLTWRLEHTLSRMSHLSRAVARILACRLLPEVAVRRLRQLHRGRAKVYRLEGLYGPLHIRAPSDGP